MGNINDNYSEQEYANIDISKLPELEKLMLHKLYILNEKFKANFREYNFHVLYKELLNFCTVDLSVSYTHLTLPTIYSV